MVIGKGNRGVVILKKEKLRELNKEVFEILKINASLIQNDISVLENYVLDDSYKDENGNIDKEAVSFYIKTISNYSERIMEKSEDLYFSILLKALGR